MTDIDDLFVFNTLLLVAASSLAIVLTSWLWHHIHPVYTSPRRPKRAHRIAAVDHKSTRSKERRRRGKDPFRELLKSGKKSKALLEVIKVADHEQPVSNSSAPGNDSASSTSRSHSPESRLCTESDDGSSIVISNTNTLAVASPEDSPCSDTVVAPPDSIEPTDAEVNISSASTIMTEASSPVVDTRTPEPRISQVAPTGNCAELFRARTRLRMSKMDQTTKSLLISSDSVASPVPSLSIVPPTHSTDGAGPSTPTNSRGSTPPLPPSQDPGQGKLLLNAQIQVASLRSALEAAQSREEQLRLEAEQASKERDEFCWRWNEDAGVWRRREAELQAQIHHLMSRLQAFSSGMSSPSPRLQHPPFPLPPAIQPQNSASAPAHVQALLASAPMLRSHPVGFAASGTGGFYSGAGVGMSPLLWSGLGLCVPNQDIRHGRRTPDSSASGSSSRGRRRTASDGRCQERVGRVVDGRLGRDRGRVCGRGGRGHFQQQCTGGRYFEETGEYPGTRWQR
ncbi:hypothetical protein JVU11DRAFT_8494 [Chiua virens]|nr:hypothetical protein JVU11DRAFT_8494 [Chiua virens]